MSKIKNNNYAIMRLLAMLCLTWFCMLPGIGLAANDDSMVINVMCAAINELTGSIGQAITIIIMVSLGIMLLLGKVTWGVAIALAVGMGVIFGAKDLVNMLSGTGTGICQ